MRKIVLRRIDRRNSKYCFDLGNDTSHEFSSKRAAKAYINKTNFFLTEKLYQTHSLYTECLIKYNSYWGYFGLSKKHNEDYACKTQLKDAQHYLNSIPEACFGPQGNVYVYQMFGGAFTSIKNTAKTLLIVARSKSITQDIYTLNDLIKRATGLENELRNYGVDHCTYFISAGKKASLNYTPKFKKL